MLSRITPKTVRQTRWGSLKRNRIPLTGSEKGSGGLGWDGRKGGKGGDREDPQSLINILSDTAAVSVCI